MYKDYFKSFTKKITLTDITVSAVMLALAVILSRVLYLPIGKSIKISLTFVPIAVAARRHPVFGITVAVLEDIIGAYVFPTGPYFWGFTLTAFVNGLVISLVMQRDLRGKYGYIKATVAAVAYQVLGGIPLNTLWLCRVYNLPFTPTLYARLITAAIMIALEIIVLPPVLKVVDKTIMKHAIRWY